MVRQMTVGEIGSALLRLAPADYAADWDKENLNVGRPGNPVRKVFLCLDITAALLEQIDDFEPELVITHHPLIFNPLENLDAGSGADISLLLQLIELGIAVWAVHTNLDYCVGGVADALAHTLGLRPSGTLCPLSPELTRTYDRVLTAELPALNRIYALEDEEKDFLTDVVPGYGRLITLPGRHSLDDLLGLCQERLNCPAVLSNTRKDRPVARLALCPGSFDVSALPDLLGAKVDAVITGECKHHELLALAAEGIAVLVVGHAASEWPVIPYLQRWLRQSCPGPEYAAEEFPSSCIIDVF